MKGKRWKRARAKNKKEKLAKECAADQFFKVWMENPMFQVIERAPMFSGFFSMPPKDRNTLLKERIITLNKELEDLKRLMGI